MFNCFKCLQLFSIKQDRFLHLTLLDFEKRLIDSELEQTFYNFVGMKQFPEGIKNIIFDLGGVLLDIDATRTIQAFRELGMPDLIKPGGWGYRHKVFLQMEQGQISEKTFRTGIRQLLPNPVSDEAIDAAWCAMIIDYAPEKIDLLKQLRDDYHLYLFSNTNSIHICHFQALFEKKFGHSLVDLFVKDYYSSDIQLRKPALESYQFVLDDAQIQPSETLFIDDSEENVNCARQTDMHAVWLSPEMNLQELF